MSLKRVLIAINDAGCREETRRNLSSWGYEVIVTSTGMEAWKRPGATSSGRCTLGGLSG